MTVTPAPPREPLSLGYLLTVAALMLVLPSVSVAIDLATASTRSPISDVVFRWFVFWAIGVRLLTAGIRQVLQPSFTAREIFHLQSPDAEVIVRELGFANICLGLCAVISGFAPSWRMAASFAGGLYFGIAGAMHLIKRPSTPNEWVALVSDVGIFVLLAALFVERVV